MNPPRPLLQPTSRLKRLAERGAALPPWPWLCLICAASFVTLVVLGTRLTFFNDDWYFLLQRPGFVGHGTADVLFAPHNGNLVVLVVLVYKGLVALFGLDSQLPFRVVLASAVASVGLLVYLLVRRRAGSLLALAAAAIVVLLGPAWEALLFFASLNLIGSLATGLAVLLALERDTQRRNVAACVLLVCSVSLSNLGIAFVVAAAVAVGLRQRPTQLWIPAVPALLFGLWWVVYGIGAPNSLSASNLVDLPLYMLRSAASGLASIVGLNPGTDADRYLRCYIVLAIAAVGIVVWLWRGNRPSAKVLVFASAAITFWALTGASYIPGREPLASRYQLVDATLLILIAAELFRPVRLRPAPAAAVAAVALFALASNVDRLLGYGYGFMREQSGYVRAELGALELARGVAPSNLWLTEAVARNRFLSGITAGRYFAETNAHGSPNVYSPRQIAAAPPKQRQAADSVLANAYRMHPIPAGPPADATGCSRLRLGMRYSEETALPDAAVLIRNPGAHPLVLGLRRFSPPEMHASVGFLRPRSSGRLPTHTDSLERPWHLSARTVSPVRSTIEVCPLRRPPRN